jgi:hypothetical protein
MHLEYLKVTIQVRGEGTVSRMVEELNTELAEHGGPHVSPSLTEFRH